MQTEPALLRIEAFDPARHDRSTFSCGVARLDNFLKQTARKQQSDDMTRVYVVVEQGQSRVLGYHAINVGMMSVEEFATRPRGAPAHGEIPILFLGQVAVTEMAQGQKLGSILMHHVFEKAAAISDTAGCHALVLDVMNVENAAAFKARLDWYASFGFQPFASNPARLFMVMAQVRALTDRS